MANEAEYWRRRDELLATYRGKWIAFDQGQVIATASTFGEVLDEIGQTGHLSAYIDRVGEEGETHFRCRRVEFSYDASYLPTALHQVERLLGREVMNHAVITFDGPAGKVIFGG